MNYYYRFLIVTFIASILLCSCTTTTKIASKDQLIISARDQKMVLVRDGRITCSFPVSTSKFGLGDKQGSYATPIGSLRVKQKIGKNVQNGTVFKYRKPTGEVLQPNSPGRDPIVTRILWLEGLEKRNKNAFSRCIYIHGTPEEKNIGKPVSYGCIRMKSEDIISLFERIKTNEQVFVTPYSLSKEFMNFRQVNTTQTKTSQRS